jgi:cysteine synthase
MTATVPCTRAFNLLPDVIPLQADLHAAFFECLKRVPAWHMLARAAQEGFLLPGGHVAETTSGTFGLGLAEACRAGGYACTLVSDPALDDGLRHRIESLGATVEVVDRPAPGGNFQQARLARLAEVVVERPGTFVPHQYDNLWNAESYAPVAAHLTERVGPIDWLVAPVGSGGSSHGLSVYLRIVNPGLRVVGVDTHGSVLFGQPEDKRVLRGLGNSVHPANVLHTAFDGVQCLWGRVAYPATRRLHAEHRIFAGPTSGASFRVAEWIATQHLGQTVVAVFPDAGHRYATTIYSPHWIAENGLEVGEAPADPTEATTPLDLDPDWAWLRWGRRTFQEVTGRPWRPEVVR